MNSIVALPIVAAVPTMAPAMSEALDADLIAAVTGVLATVDAINEIHREHAAAEERGEVKGNADDRADYQALADQRDVYLERVIELRAVSAAGVRAKASVLKCREIMEWHEMHRDIADSLADDLLGTVTNVLPAPLQPTVSQHPDAELIALATEYEPLVDQFYTARAVWSPLLFQANEEVREKFGGYHSDDPAKEKRRKAALKRAYKRLGVRKADDAMAAVREQMREIEEAIEALPCASLEGLRAKALVAFREVAPLCAGDSTFSFDDAYPFEQLFTAVAGACGLTEKVTATGYELPSASEEAEELEA